MRLSVATNFEPELVDALKNYPVVELYGKLRSDAVGGGRAPYQLAPVGRRQLAEHVAHARKAEIGFNYLLNAACSGNREITRRGQRELFKLLDWVSDIGASAVTVATPMMLKFVKTHMPHLRVRVSLFAGVDRVRKAQMWEDLGADCIVLDSLLVNREFESLRQLRKNIGCDLELLVNNNCLQSCALSPAHMNALAHVTKDRGANGGFFIDWCFLTCTRMKMQDPINYVRSEWIRPEDLHVYEDLGYDLFKIVERDIPTPILLRRVKAYTERRYDGNLLDLIQPFGFGGVADDERYYRRGLAKLRWLLRFALRPRLVDPRRMLRIKELADQRGMTRPVVGEPPVYVDNRALDGFIKRFEKQSCRDRNCDECGWCAAFAEKAVRIDAGHREEVLAAYDGVFSALDSGAMWGLGDEEACRSSKGGPS